MVEKCDVAYRSRFPCYSNASVHFEHSYIVSTICTKQWLCPRCNNVARTPGRVRIACETLGTVLLDFMTGKVLMSIRTRPERCSRFYHARTVQKLHWNDSCLLNFICFCDIYSASKFVSSYWGILMKHAIWRNATWSGCDGRRCRNVGMVVTAHIAIMTSFGLVPIVMLWSHSYIMKIH